MVTRPRRPYRRCRVLRLLVGRTRFRPRHDLVYLRGRRPPSCRQPSSSDKPSRRASFSSANWHVAFGAGCLLCPRVLDEVEWASKAGLLIVLSLSSEDLRRQGQPRERLVRHGISPSETSLAPAHPGSSVQRTLRLDRLQRLFLLSSMSTSIPTR